MTVMLLFFFFFNDTATTEIYTLSLHDALPILVVIAHRLSTVRRADRIVVLEGGTISDIGAHDDLMKKLGTYRDRKSTRLNSSHSQISYAVFCLKKKNMFFPAPLITYSRPLLLP